MRRAPQFVVTRQVKPQTTKPQIPDYSKDIDPAMRALAQNVQPGLGHVKTGEFVRMFEGRPFYELPGKIKVSSCESLATPRIERK